MFKKLSILCALLAFTLGLSAQELLTPSHSFSGKKTSYLTLEDGTELRGTIEKIKRKKGLITSIKVDADGKKQTFKPAQVKFMYLMPSGFDKYGKGLSTLLDAQKWTDEKIDQDLVNQGYVYFEQARVKVKKKESTMLMQLLNPTFSSKVKVYHDPFAKSTASVGVGPVTVAGGNEKSYYVSVNSATAFKLEKKAYKKEFTPLWKACGSMAQSFSDIKWNEFTKHVLAYSDCE